MSAPRTKYQLLQRIWPYIDIIHKLGLHRRRLHLDGRDRPGTIRAAEFKIGLGFFSTETGGILLAVALHRTRTTSPKELPLLGLAGEFVSGGPTTVSWEMSGPEWLVT